MTFLRACACLAFIAACQSPEEVDDSMQDDSELPPDAPLPSGTARIMFPPGRITGTMATVLHMRGTADATAVFVNGQPALSDDGFATWRIDVPLKRGLNELTVSTEVNGTRLEAIATTTVDHRPLPPGQSLRSTQMLPDGGAKQGDAAALQVVLGLVPGSDHELITFSEWAEPAIQFHGAPLARLDLDTMTQTEFARPVATSAIRVGPTIVTGGVGGSRCTNGVCSEFAPDIIDAASGAVLQRSLLAAGAPYSRWLGPIFEGVLPGGGALMCDATGTFFGIDLETGVREVVSSQAPLECGRGGIVDGDRNRALWLGSTCTLMAVDLSTGQRTCAYTFEEGQHMTAITSDGERAFIAVASRRWASDGRIVALDLSTGETHVLSDVTEGLVLAESVFSMTYEPSLDVLFANLYGGLAVIDAVTGQRVAPVALPR